MAGRGRGRGRGSSSVPRASARDDEGKPMPLPQQPQEGPPPLYPPKTLPDALDSSKIQEVEPYIRSLRVMNSQYKLSPFHPISQSEGGNARKRKASPSRGALASVVTLDPNNIPPELYTEEQRAAGGTLAAQAAYWASASIQARHKRDIHDLDLSRFEELEAREQRQDHNGGASFVDVEEEMAREEAEAADEAEADGMGDDDGLGDGDIDPYEVYDDDDEGYNDDDDGDGEAYM